MSPVTPQLPQHQHQHQHQHYYLPLPTTPLHSPALSAIDMPSPFSPATSSSSLPSERSVSPKRQPPSARSCRLHRPLHPFQFLGLIILIISLTFIHPHSRAFATSYFSSTSNYLSDYLSDSPGSSHAISHIPPPTGGVPSHLRIPLTLEARLSYLLSRPALWQYEAELPSRHKCPFYTYNRNVYFFHEGKQEQWERITPSDIRRYRSKIVDYLRGVERDGGKLVWDKSMEEGVPKEMRRGIIYAAGEGVCVASEHIVSTHPISPTLSPLYSHG
jgi:alpha 1,2-mannosyltransferase